MARHYADAYHEAAHAVIALRIGLKILGITMVSDPQLGYAAAMATESRREWIMAAQPGERQARAEDIIRMLSAGPALEEHVSADPMRGFRSANDLGIIGRIIREFIPGNGKEQLATYDRIRAEMADLFANEQAPERKAAEALAAVLIERREEGLDGDEISAIVAPRFA